MSEQTPRYRAFLAATAGAPQKNADFIAWVQERWVAFAEHITGTPGHPFEAMRRTMMYLIAHGYTASQVHGLFDVFLGRPCTKGGICVLANFDETGPHDKRLKFSIGCEKCFVRESDSRDRAFVAPPEKATSSYPLFDHLIANGAPP